MCLLTSIQSHDTAFPVATRNLSRGSLALNELHDREGKTNVTEMHILHGQHDSYTMKYSTSVQKRKQKVNVRLIIL